MKNTVHVVKRLSEFQRAQKEGCPLGSWSCPEKKPWLTAVGRGRKGGRE